MPRSESHRHFFKFKGRYMTMYMWECACGERYNMGCNGFWKGWKNDPPWEFVYPTPDRMPTRRPLPLR